MFNPNNDPSRTQGKNKWHIFYQTQKDNPNYRLIRKPIDTDIEKRIKALKAQ